MKAGGISLYRATLPVVLIALLGSRALFAMRRVPAALHEPHRGRGLQRDQGPPAAVRRATSSAAGSWAPTTASTTTTTSRRAPARPGRRTRRRGGHALRPVASSTWTPRAGSCATRLYAARGASGTGRATTSSAAGGARFGARPRLQDVQRRRAPASSSRRRYFTREEPAAPTRMRFAELRAHIAALEPLGVDVAKLQVQLHRKLAFPMVRAGDDAARHPASPSWWAAAARSTASASAS